MDPKHTSMNTPQLEEMLSDQGVLFREYRGDGFMVVGDKTVFIVKDHEENEFEFIEVPEGQIAEVHLYKDRPSGKERNMSEDEVEVNEENHTDCTKVTIWASSHATRFFVEAKPQSVAATFIAHRIS